jgi:hypothetical protein
VSSASEFEKAFAAFLEKAQERANKDYAAFQDGVIGNPPKLEAEPGKRYIRIIAASPGQRHAWAFVDTINGDVLKPDGWKRPAKGARGNVYDEYNGTGRVRWTGVR